MSAALKLLEARKMRAEGYTIASIALRLGVSEATAGRYCAGVECPVRHKRGRRITVGRRSMPEDYQW